MQELGLTDEQIHLCRIMGLDPQEFANIKRHSTDPYNINPNTGFVEWRHHTSMPLESLEAAKAKAREVRRDCGLLVDKRPLEVLINNGNE